jgi:predicted nucleotidyltransferase
MTTMSRTWQQLAPRRGAISQLAPGDPDAWAARLRFDRERAASNQSAELAAITEVAIGRAQDAGAAAMVLSGSTARGRRTRVSDVDYHVIGATSLRVTDLPADIDLYADDVDRFWTKLRKGDDFAHWSVWYGCVLFDSGVIHEATTYVAEQDAWPDPDRKLRQARNALDFAEQIAESSDYAAALEQTRGTLSLVARWILLSSDVFPLARDELAGQLEQLGQARLAIDLRRSIRERPSLGDLQSALVHARAITGVTAGAPV